MCGCSEQKYLYSPAAVNVNAKVPSVSMVFDLNLPAQTTVWGMSSRLVHVTVWPTFTLSCCGWKTKLSICTANGSAAASSATAATTGRNRVATAAMPKSRRLSEVICNIPSIAFSSEVAPVRVKKTRQTRSLAHQRRVDDGQRLVVLLEVD